MIVPNPRRAGSDGPGVRVEDFADVPGCTAVAWAEGGLSVEFDRELTAEEQARVRLRCQSLNAVEEELRRRGLAALQGNRDYLAGPQNGTTAVVQVERLTRQMNGVIRMLLQELDGTE